MNKKRKKVITKSFLSKIIEPNSYTKKSFLSEIYIYIHISIRNPFRIPCDNAVLDGTATSNGK